MTKLAAFVGHSFSLTDEGVVTAFLSFLTTVSGVVPGFTWDHAEEAAPKELSEKVRGKMEGKNLFIAICTARERVIQVEKLSVMPLFKSRSCGNAIDFQSKTSDWVTQEIAYALGRDMDLIVLLEKGVRVPGGLQGNLEYIEFTREAPANSFNKILQMIKALTPKALVTETGMLTPVAADEKSAKPADEPEYREPQLSWTRSEYEEAIANAIWSERVEHQSKILECFNKSQIGVTEDIRAEFEGYAIDLSGLFGKATNLSRLRELVHQFPFNSRLHGYLAQALNRFSQFQDAAIQFIEAAELATSDPQRADWTADAAVAKHKAGDTYAEQWLRAQFKTFSLADVKIRNLFLRALRQFAATDDQNDRWLCYTEARLQSTPEDHELRSDLAYKYFEKKKFSLALLHFFRIPAGKRSTNDWNNIGASYIHMEMPGRAIIAYQKSHALGGTTAVSNLAYNLIGAGFFEEGEQLCKKVVALPDCDKRVAAALSSIASKVEMETSDFDKAIETATIQQRSLVDLGFACAAIKPKMPEGHWKTPECIVDVKVGPGAIFCATGKFLRDETVGLRGILSLRAPEGAASKQTEITVTYAGTVVGNACFFTRSTSDDRGLSSHFSASSTKGYLIFSEDAPSMREIRQLTSGSDTLSYWTKV